MYYSAKLRSLRDIFGTETVVIGPDFIEVEGVRYPVFDDVIILSGASKQSDYVRGLCGQNRHCEEPLDFSGGDEALRLCSGLRPELLPKDEAISGCRSEIASSAGMKTEPPRNDGVGRFARDVQYSFGEEWRSYDRILPEHKEEFQAYFDIVNPDSLKGKRICDLGCGNGRWSHFLKKRVREIVLVDFSDAIFTARKNLSEADNCLFFMCDLKELPFRDDFADLLFCLGVLHHLPTPCLDEVRGLKKYSKSLLVYLYYALDNRPFYFRLMLGPVTFLRERLSRLRAPASRKAIALAATLIIYMPLIVLGKMLEVFNLGRSVPLYEGYRNKSAKRISQDAYDRFFTPIEQRVSRKDIEKLKDTFSSVTVSENPPYWHFLCKS